MVFLKTVVMAVRGDAVSALDSCSVALDLGHWELHVMKARIEIGSKKKKAGPSEQILIISFCRMIENVTNQQTTKIDLKKV